MLDIYVILSGILQGLTEFLPVSSSGHLVLMRYLFGFREPDILFTVLLHIATLLAIVFFLRKEIRDLLRWERRGEWASIITATLITGLLGLFCHTVFAEMFGTINRLGYAFLTTAFFLFCAHATTKGREGSYATPTIYHAVLIGLLQGLAIIPGISRSGVTIAIGIMTGLKKRTAFTFSFLIAIPATVGAFLFELKEAPHLETMRLSTGLLGGIMAFITGLLALKLLQAALIRDKFHLFSVYCLIIGLATIIISFAVR